MFKNKARIFSLISVASNILFCVYNLFFSALTLSWWMLTLGVYYACLGGIRMFSLKSGSNGYFTQRTVGIMLILTVIPLVGTVILASVKNRGTKIGLIVMLAIATYSFTKIVMAIINLIKLRRIKSTKLTISRSISFADALVSIFSLQRSMLVSFEGMSNKGITVMNIATGSGVCLLVLLLGANLFLRAKRE